MQIYRFVGSALTVAGAGSMSTANINGGILRHVFIKSGTANVTFQANVQDPDLYQVRAYGATYDTINDTSVTIPVQGVYTVQITNANTNGLFNIRLMIQE